MLDKSDTDTVRGWLLLALTVAEKQGKTASDLAAWCNVSPQAVNGWKKTGRITKGNLERAALFFGSGPSFTRGAGVVAREPAVGGWPFPDLDRARFERLSPNQRIEIQGLVRERIERFEAAAPSPAPPASRARPATTPARRASRPKKK
jgi:hypothetical protein